MRDNERTSDEIPSSRNEAAFDLPRYPQSHDPLGMHGPIKHARKQRDDDDDDEDSDDDDDRRPAKSKKKPSASGGGSGKIILIILSIAGVLLCCCSVSIVGAVLVFPALDKVQGSATQIASKNNLKQIGLSLHRFSDINRRMPFNGSNLNNYRTGAVANNPMSGSWGFQILPFIEQDVVYRTVNRGVAIKTFMCPGRSRPPLEAGRGAWSDYFLNGYLNDPEKADNPGAADRKRTIAGITDGSSNTVAFAHGNIRKAQYASQMNVTLCSNIFDGGTFGTMRSGAAGGTNPGGVLLRPDGDDAPVSGGWGGPFSTGCLAVMGDGSVRTFPYSTANFGMFLTPVGGEAVNLP